MSDRIRKMKKDIRIATAVTIGIYSVLFVWLISPNFLKMIPTWADIIAFASPFILGGLASYFIILDTHNWFDKKFFRERKKVDDYIREQVTTPCRDISCNRAERGILNNEETSLMNLFYTFIPPSDTERERAFSYWTEYWVTVNLSVFSILGAIVAVICIAVSYLFNDLLTVSLWAFITILALAFLLNLPRLKARRKLIHPARAQTTRILSDNKPDLIRKLPDYRVGCDGCPL